MQTRWILREGSDEVAERISRSEGVSPLVARVLAARGILEPAQARAFLNPTLSDLPDPLLIPGMEAAVDRLLTAVRKSEPVWVYTDYDVDGVTSAALLTRFFAESGIKAQVHLPRRDLEGYGLNAEALRRIADQGGTLVVTADCGVNAVDETSLARELGIDLVITDHHTPGEVLPDAAAVVNPRLPSSRYPDPDLAGVGVAWNLAAALRRRLREKNHYPPGGEPDIRDHLDLVALGSVADVVPLVQVNRALVAYGLQVLNRTPPRPGIQALREVAGLKGNLEAGHLGFQLGPRLNAAGRMGGPRDAFDLLLTEDPQRARLLAERLNGLNQERRDVELRILDEAERRVESEGWHPDRWSLAVESEGWHPGVIGIVASRLVSRFYRPAAVMSVSGDEAKGSARSIPGLHLCQVLAECEDLLERYGGHGAAAGFTVAADRVDLFRERFEEAVRRRLTPENLVPVTQLDAAVDFAGLNREVVQELERLKPFGMGNHSPVLLSSGVRVLDVSPLGRTGDHLKLRLEQGDTRLTAKAWGGAKRLAHVAPGQQVDLAHKPGINNWNGIRSVELVVEGIREAGEGISR